MYSLLYVQKLIVTADIDECESTSDHDCPISSYCMNTNGTYKCICTNGTQMDAKSGNCTGMCSYTDAGYTTSQYHNNPHVRH